MQKLVNGELVDMTEQEIAEFLAEGESFKAGKVERQWEVLRKERNAYLSACDWTQVIDAPVDQQAWANYRQALRDLPENTVDPFNPVWPTKP